MKRFVFFEFIYFVLNIYKYIYKHTLTQNLPNNVWFHAFPKGISVKWNANRLEALVDNYLSYDDNYYVNLLL